MGQKNRMLKKMFACALIVVLTIAAAPLLSSIGADVPAWTELTATKASAFSARTTMPTSDNAYYYSGNPFYKGGYGLPNCTCYAFGRAWEVTGQYPKLSTGDAGSWYGYNKSNNYYAYGSTPKAGAIACWSGHVAFVESVNSDGTINFSESNWRGRKNPEYKFRYLTNKNPYSYTSGFQGYIYVVSDASAPTSAKLSINKNDFKIGEEFIMTLSADAGCQFYLSIIDSDSGETVLSENVSGTYRSSFQRAGHYSAHMSAFNSKGGVDSNWIDFYVFGSAPTSAKLSADKSYFDVGESVILNTSTDAYYVKIYISILRDNAAVYSGNIPYSFKYKLTQPGVYTAYVSAYTHEGGVDSNRVTLYVGKYNVTFNPNGGQCTTPSKKVTYGKTYGTLPVPSRTGYVFDGWYTSANGGKKVTSSTTVTSTANHTLYAHWTETHTHSYSLTSETAPSCTVAGKKIYRCSCGDSYTEDIPATGHKSVKVKGKAATCTKPGLTDGAKCSVCGKVLKAQTVIKATGHKYVTAVEKATLTKDGARITKCAHCNAVKAKTAIAKVESVKLTKTSFRYNGEVQLPNVIVKDSDGKTLRNYTDYIVRYTGGCKNVGRYNVRVIFMGNYSGSKAFTFNIVPKSTVVAKLTAGNNQFTALLGRQVSQVTGYELQYSLKSDMSDAETLSTSNNKTTSLTVKNLTSGKKYYVRVRTYKTVTISGQKVKIYSSWSAVKNVQVK